MGRSKKNQEEIENLEPELEEAMEAEELEAAEEETEEEEVEEKPARKPRARKPRKAKEPTSLLGAMSKPVDEEAKEAKAEEAAEEETETAVEVEAEAEEEVVEKKPAPRRSRKAVAAAKEEAEEAETIGKPWVAVKDISVSISSNLEKVNQMLREIPQQELFRPPVAKPAAITKVAVGMSFFAIVLSLVSLLLSTNARQVALERVAAPATVVQSVPTSPAEPKQLALEWMKRKPQYRNKKSGR